MGICHLIVINSDIHQFKQSNFKIHWNPHKQICIQHLMSCDIELM